MLRVGVETSKPIALDEARHAALAWRTVAWICFVDHEACEVVEKRVFDSSAIKRPSCIVVFRSKFAFAADEPSHCRSTDQNLLALDQINWHRNDLVAENFVKKTVVQKPSTKDFGRRRKIAYYSLEKAHLVV